MPLKATEQFRADHLWCLPRSHGREGWGEQLSYPCRAKELTKPFEVRDAPAFIVNSKSVGVCINIALFTKPEACIMSAAVSEGRLSVTPRGCPHRSLLWLCWGWTQRSSGAAGQTPAVKAVCDGFPALRGRVSR